MTGSHEDRVQKHAAMAATLVDDAPCGFAVIDLRERVLYANATLGRWLDRDAAALEDGGKVSAILTPASYLYYQTQIAPMIQLQGFAREISCELKGEAGARPVLMSAILRQGSEGARVEMVFFDATERLRFEAQLRAARVESEELAAIVRQATSGILRCDAAGGIKRMNDAAAAILGVPRGQVPQDPIGTLLLLDDLPDDWFTRAVAQITEPGNDVRLHASRGDKHYDISVGEIAVHDDPFATRDFSVVLRDVSAQVISGQRLQLMVKELNHRIQNVFAVIIGVVRQTVRQSDSEREKLIERLLSISTSHSRLTQNYWKDVDIMAIFEPVVGQASDGQKVTLTGPDIRLAPDQFKALSMAVHELATNARKYGALKSDTGEIEIAWTLSGTEGRDFGFTWRERGGPPVSCPQNRGFGTMMIEKVLASEFNGTAEMTFPPEGLEFQCRGVLQTS